MTRINLEKTKEIIQDSKALQKQGEESLDLYRTLKDIVPKSVLNKNNKSKSWKSGYNKLYDIIIISKDGTLGQIIEVQNLKNRVTFAAEESFFKEFIK